MEPREAAVPPRTTTSGRRYKALMPWRFQHGFVRKPYKGPTAAGAASAAPRGVKVGGSAANGSRSAPVGGGGAGVGDPVSGQVKKRGRPFGPGKGPDGKKMKMESDARSAGMDSQSMGRSTRSATMKSRPNGEKTVNSARSGAEEDIQSKRSTRSETAKSYKEVKMEKNSPQSGAEEDIQSKRSTRSETVNSSRRDEKDNGAHSGAGKDCQLKRGTGSVTMKTSNGEKTEKSARSGADKDCQLKRGTDSVTMKSSNGEKTKKSAGGGAGKDCQLKRGTDSVTMKSSNGEKTEKSAGSGASKDCQLKRGTDSVAMKSSNGEKTEKSAGSGAGKDCQLKRGTDSVTMKSSNGEKTEKSARSGADKECGLGKSKSSGNIVGDGLASAAGGDCDLGGSDCNRVARDKHNQNFETGSSIGAGDGAACAPEGNEGNLGAENCVSEGSKKSCVNRSGLKSKKSSATDHVLEEPAGKGGSTGNGASKESDVAAKGCSSAVPGSNGIGTNCRRGWKAIMPWRFQIGYKRSFSKAFGSNTGSVETPEYRAQGSSTQSTPGTRSTVRCYASPLSNVRISAMQDFSSGKGEKKTQTACKKVKTEKDDHNQGMPVNGVALARENVMRSLSDFRLIYKNLLVKLEDRSKEGGTDLQAYKIFREKYLAECNDMTYVGNVPGIHVGDIFHARVEISVVGLHRPHRKGIDYVKNEDGTCIAVSIVAYARLADVKNNLDAFIYSGSMKATLNQKIEGNNRALKKSMETKTPVRVIHGFGTHPQGNSQRKNVLIYGGLYLVEKYWREKESEDRYVYLFRMRRISGQKHINIEKILKLAQAEPFDGVIMKDISQGLERIPIPVVNSISSEHPMTYHYMSRLKYPPNYQPAPPAGCGCVGGCSDSKPCACAVKNGGEIPFNDNGRIIVAKPLVYECGPSCKCPPTCHNRVGQKGIKFRLQVFKTKSMGWGVKTLDFIPSGSFVCEYIGEVLDDEEAQRRMNDEYLFAIGHNYYDETLWEGLSRSIPSLQSGPPKDEEAGFAVDASKMGNFAKFINHSCSPNLYAQNVLYDHDDKSAPHIMFFACEDIPAHQELAYHYNYAIDQVHDADGNIKKKKCLCGSPECDGWLY